MFLGIRVGGGSGAVRRVAGGLAMRSGRSDWDVDDLLCFGLERIQAS
jgi:hypothetical protein